MWPGYYLFKHQENIRFWSCCLCCYMNNQISPCFPPRYASHLPYGRGTRLLVSHLEFYGYTKPYLRNWKGSCSCKGFGFGTQHLYGFLQPSVIPVLGETASCVFWFPQVSGTHIICLHICNQNTKSSIKNEYIS